jgi:hypothetical protein
VDEQVPPYLILAEPGDTTAVAVAGVLAARHGFQRVEIRTPLEIVLAPRWTHRLNDNGPCCIEFHDGRFLETPAAVLNRLQYIPAPPGFVGADRDYAVTELTALVLSWLTQMDCPVLNRPSPSGIGGALRGQLAWQQLATQAGLKSIELQMTTSTRDFPVRRDFVPRSTASWHADSLPGLRVNEYHWCSERVDTTDPIAVHVIGARASGAAPETILEKCRCLARLAQLDIIRIDLVRSCEGLKFLSADAQPHMADPALSVCVADALEARVPAARAA